MALQATISPVSVRRPTKSLKVRVAPILASAIKVKREASGQVVRFKRG